MSLQDFSANKLRESYIDFFSKRGHKAVPSASLVPQNDPTVLFTTAGMHPLVPYLLGENHPEGKRLVNVQPCLRTDDVDEVGDDTHLTFFEMLGNWSLGDPASPDGVGEGGYWKEDAIKWSFEYLTKELGIDVKNLAVSCFAGDSDAPRDEGSARIWRSLGVSPERIAFLGKKDNWWGPAGETGPCGPDTEMFVWVGEGDAPQEFDGPQDTRWVEIWNDVFMQYDKKSNGSYEPLRQKNVDTGMGFERMLAYLQGKSDVYQTELFSPIINKIEELSGGKYPDNREDFRIIVDHIKAAVFVLAEKIEPSNKLRGYVLRRLIRRAITRSINLKIEKGFCQDVAEIVLNIYKDSYPQLEKNRGFILAEIDKEEGKFRKNIKAVKWDYREVSGRELFNLYQSFGVPVEVSLEELASRKIKIKDSAKAEYKKLLDEHQQKSRTASSGMFKGGLADSSEITTKMHTATHLLLAALRQVLGDHVIQRGANITSERIRFDFSHDQKMTDEEIKKVEQIVNEKIKENLPVECEEMSLEEAKNSGAMGVFNDKYGSRVKVYSAGNPSADSGQAFSRELCGGPHVSSTGEIGHFKIIKEESSSSGVRRVKAILK